MWTSFFRLSLFLFCAFGPTYAQTNPAWITQIAPFQIADNLYYVGSQELASYLVVTPNGNILINANLASSPPQIRTSVESCDSVGPISGSC
jgi:metallo-beta-lactamase class B